MDEAAGAVLLFVPARSTIEMNTKTSGNGGLLDKSYYSDGLKKLENCWIKCIKLKGDYVEK
ncbi:hypothetical protein ALC53_03527 [Atta colombica]|uniref:Uncharacterized protein n=1 Tax=Atta colombica TaxID=520822 RepID=A0A195BP17_9HYME|nr:hypothetical protein ALC53_03527 [Atta colombica]